MVAKALVTGITGQDGSYMAELLLEKGYEVYGLIRYSSTRNLARIEHILGKITLVSGDIADAGSVSSIIRFLQPDELYNFAGHPFVPISWTEPDITFKINSLGVLNILQAIVNHSPKTKLLQASSSEMYGNSYPEFKPVSPYGVSKLTAHSLLNAYRIKHGLFACSAISFNHESPRRGHHYVTQKIANYVKNPVGKLKLGSLDVKRDWGYAGDYVKAYWLMLQQSSPLDCQVATGESHTVSEFLDLALPVWRDYVQIDFSLIRKNEVSNLKGDPEVIKSLGWQPSVSFSQLVSMMVQL